MRCNRSLDPRFEAILLPGEPLRYLVDVPLRTGDGQAGRPLDLQLREGNRIAFYVGLTAILNVKLTAPLAPRRLSAHREYSKQFDAFGLQREYMPGELADAEAAVTRYLKEVFVNEHHYTGEGRCQNWLSHRYGPQRRAGEFVAVDREVVIGYVNEQEKTREWRGIKRRLDDFGARLPEIMREEYDLAVQSKSVGNEADAVLWDPVTGHFHIAEVKDGSSAAGVYLSPIQLSAYLQAWRRFAEVRPKDALAGMRDLIKQKARLGLLPPDTPTPSRMEPRNLVPALIVQEPNPRSGCWERLDKVIDLLQKHIPDALAGLHVYEATDRGLADISDTWRKWI